MIALDMPCGPAMVDRIAKAWDDGDAVFPLDQRAPATLREHLVSQVGATRICRLDGDWALDGVRTETGDAVVIATSGTTGQPKFVVHTMSALLAGAERTHKRLQVGIDDAWLCCLPPWHIGGFGVIARSLLTGTRVVAVESFDIQHYKQAAHDGATLVSLVPTALQRVDPGLYRTILLGGSRPPGALPPNCVTTYGMTETGGGIVYDGVALDDVEVEIRDGVIHLRAPMMMRCLRDGTTPVDETGWYRTNDLGRIGNDGRLVVDGRLDDVIITGGENVWPDVVEAVLNTHPLVRESCVVGVDDPEWGQVVLAWIVPEGDERVHLASIRDHVKAQLAPHCAPRRLEFTDALPRTSLGKLARSQLRGNVPRD